MSNGVTGLSGKNWMSTLSNKRVELLLHDLKNGGRALTYDELKDKVNAELPGGIPMGIKSVKKAVYAVDAGIDVKDFTELWTVKMPSGGGAKKWEEKREKQRLSFLSDKKSHDKYNKKIKKLGVKTLGEAKEEKRCKRGHRRTPDNLYANGACKQCNTVLSQNRSARLSKKSKRRMHPLEAIERSRETSLDSITSSMGNLPDELRSWLKEDIAPLMEKHKLKTLSLTILSDGPHASWELAPQSGNTKL